MPVSSGQFVQKRTRRRSPMDFNGKVALITGAGNGIGRATALAFAAYKAKVVVVDRDGPGAERTAGTIKQQGGDALAVTADVTKSADVQAYVKAAVDAYGRIDCFFNNAGIEGKLAPTAEYDEAMFDQVLAVNVKGVFLGLRYVLPVMIAKKSGAIVNTASIAGLVGSPNMPAYVASKHAVVGLTKAVAGENARLGIRVNAVCPGPVDTRMIHSVEAQINPNDPGRCRQALHLGHSARALRYAGGDREHRGVPVLGPRQRHYRCTVRDRRRAHGHWRRGDTGGQGELSRLANSAELPAPGSVAAVATLGHAHTHEAVVCKRRADPQFVPGVEHGGRKRFAFCHQAPRRLTHRRACTFHLQYRVVALAAGQPSESRGEPFGSGPHSSQQGRNLVEGLHSHQPSCRPRDMASFFRAKHRDGLGQDRGDVFHRVIAKDLAQALFRP
jgi:NAD(P)-dependent dehydrogenase (short-subunit alcohol dehydrogenase family)